MKEVVYKLKSPQDGIKELVLHAPTRKQIKFAAAVKSAFMRVAMEMAEKIDSPSGKSDDSVLQGSDMLSALYAGSADVGDLIDRFQCACTNSPMCQMNGGPVPEALWDNMTMEDVEGLFAEFLGNFIII